MTNRLNGFLRNHVGLYLIGLLVAAEAHVFPEATNSEATETISRVWLGLDGKALPFRNDGEVLEFLRTAQVVSWERVREGINRILKVRLEKDGIQTHAAFRDVKVFKRRFRLQGRVRLAFRDEAVFECAAYELSRLLGLNNVPPTVERRVHGKKGSLQLWIEKAITEKNRRTRKIEVPDKKRFMFQMQSMRLFDNLIYNEDRNQGNILYGPDWELWLIDHTRAFRTDWQLRDPTKIWYCERGVWEKLQSLTEEMLKKTLKKFLCVQEIRAILKRRDKLVEHIQKLIEKRGEKSVLWTLDRPAQQGELQKIGP
ncbi:hypothetical protein MYX84_10760 [Acidobacteria bacterium AH-259-O06]|nr:hypothetical protein [Acidobacteria bacterium AH-259-O06]